MAKERDTADPGVAGKLKWLRDSVKAQPEGVADSTWAWIDELSNRAKSDTAAAVADLNELFRLGTVPTDLHGATEGKMVTTMNPKVDTVLSAFTALWNPWQGKRFDNQAATGCNRLTKSTGLLGKLLWPLYSMRDHTDGKLAFDFKTYVEPGKEDPDVDVMVGDYADIEKNPKLIISKTRDELVQLVPGVYLGKLYTNTGSGYSKLGYYALRTPR
jgi:hypothetical protein